MKKIVCCIILVAFSLVLAKPMESIERCNIILVHGAAPESQGFGSECRETIKDAWNTRNDFIFSKRDSTQDKKLSK